MWRYLHDIILQAEKVMSKETLRDLIIIVGAFAALWLAFSLIPWKCESPTDTSFAVEKERELGRVIVEDWMLKEGDMKEVHGPEVDSAMAILLGRLLQATGDLKHPITLRVINEADINAFTLPGGQVLVHSGMVKFCETPEELCAVLAHELGHVQGNHVTARLVKELGLTVLFAVLTGGDAVLTTEVAKTATATYFDRNQEREADDLAWETLVKANIDPRTIATVFRRMKEEQGDVPGLMKALSTHPDHEERVRRALEKPLPQGFKAQPIELNWELVRQAVEN